MDHRSEIIRDPDRLEAVRRTGLLDSPPEEVFDRLTRLAAKIVGAPVTFISVVDEDRDFYKSCVGFGEPLASTREVEGTTFCHYTLPLREPLVINDTRADPEYRKVPTVESLGVAAYLGIPLITSGGQAVGSFCAVDFQPREWRPTDVEVIQELAASAMREIELRQEVAERLEAERTLREQADALTQARREAERRAMEEAALRRAAQAVTASYTVEEASRRIAESAVEATHADDAFVERIDLERDEVVVAAVGGERAPPLGARLAYAGSFARLVVEQRRPELIPRIGTAGRPLPGDLQERCGDCAALVVPLQDGGESIGALVLLRLPQRGEFRPDEIARAQTFADLTALAFRKVHLLEESERRRREIEAVTESRTRLMRGFSHDLKNPLGAADGYAQLLQDGILGPLSDRQQESVQRIRVSLRNALELINALVEMARTEVGYVELDLRPTDVRDVVAEAAEEFRAQAEAAGLALRRSLPDHLPVIRSDPSRLQQVLGNLISNAVKYNREGGRVEIEAALRSRNGDLDQGCIAVAVSDTGVGIPPEKRHLLFREFSRLHDGTRPGAGLGLAISQRIARALGGEITVESEPGRGSTFTLWLPLQQDDARLR